MKAISVLPFSALRDTAESGPEAQESPYECWLLLDSFKLTRRRFILEQELLRAWAMKGD